jgi:hypothetical protein
MLIKNCHLSILSPLPLLLTAFSIFFGLGTSASTLSSEATQAVINANFAVTPEGLWKVIAANLCGTICVIGGISFAISLFSKFSYQINGVNISPREETLKISLAIFSVVGLFIYFGLVLPVSIGVVNITVPGAIQQLGQCAYVALIQSAYMFSKYGRRYFLPFAILTLALLFASLSLFMKEVMILSIALPFVGLFLHKNRLRYIFIGGIATAVVFVLLVPVVVECRSSIVNYSKSRLDDVVIRASFEKRIFVFLTSCVKVYSPQSTSDKDYSGEQRWWSRLCYNSPQSFVIDRYDGGLPGNTLKNAFATVIPRLIWPSKPITARVAVEFQQLYTKRWYDNTTSIGIGIFGESYWIGGWLGVVAICTLIGLEIGVLTIVAARHINQKDHMLMLPALGAGLMIARGIDRFIVMAFIGSVPIFLGVYFISFFFRNLVRQMSEHR